jgi:hypothetical protein
MKHDESSRTVQAARTRDIDPEQVARDERTDLCGACKAKHHDACGEDINCLCCLDTREASQR